MNPRLGRAIAGGLAGAAAWLSCGVVAMVSSHGNLTTAGLAPPLAALGVLAALGAVVGYFWTNISVGELLLGVIAVPVWLGVTSPALLMWAGPLVAVPWSALMASVVADAFRRNRIAQQLTAKAAGLRAVALTSIAALSIFAWSISPALVSGDEPHYLVIANSIIHDRDVELTNDYEFARYGTFYSGGLEPRHTIYTAAGRHYSFHGLGTGFLVAPGLAIAGVMGARLTIMLISAAGAIMLWMAARSVTGSTTAAWVALTSLVFQVPFMALTSSIYPDAPATAITSFALWTLTRIERRDRVSVFVVAATGFALAALPWLHVRLSVIAVAVSAGIVALAWRGRISWSHVVWFSLGPLVSAELWIVGTMRMFDSIDPTAAFRQKASGSLLAAPEGVLGLLADQQYGLLPYAPAMAFALLGMFKLRRSLPVTTWSVVAAAATTLVVSASYVWWGGSSSPARFLVPILPICALWLGVWWCSATPMMRSACIMGIMISACLLAIGTAVDRGSHLVNQPDGRNSVFEVASHSVDIPGALPSMFRDGSTAQSELAITAVWLIAAVALLTLLGAIVRRLETRIWPLVVWASIVWVMVAVSASWAVRGRLGTTVDRSQLKLLQASSHSWLQTGVAEGRLVSDAAVLPMLSFRLPSATNMAKLLELPQIPAGRYRLEVADAPERSSIAVSVDRSDRSIWTWALNAYGTLDFALPVPVRTLSVTSSNMGSKMSVRLRPLGRLPWNTSDSDVAQHVARYRDVVCYSLDTMATLEDDGFWLWSGRRTAFVIARDDGSTPAILFRLKAGDTAVTVRFTRARWSEEVSLTAGGTATVAVPIPEVPGPFVVEVSGPRNAYGVWVTMESRIQYS